MENLSADPVEFQRRRLKPPRKGMVIGIVIFMVVFLVAPAVWFIWAAATCTDVSLGFRGIVLLFAAVLLLLPCRVAWITVRRKWRTGRWVASPEERLEMRRKWFAQDSPSRQQKFKIVTTISWIVAVGLSITTAVRGATPLTWIVALSMTFAAIASLGNVYRKPKPATKS